MTTAAIRSPRIRTYGRLGCWPSVRHSLRAEAAAALTLYGLYELARGLVGADTADPDGHAHRVVALERSLHLFVEANVQRAVQTRPGITSLFGVAYLTLHLAVTAGVLLWLHRRRPEGFPFVRTALLLASGLALLGFLVSATAPPRLAGVGVVDTVSGRQVDLNRGLVSSLYNPYAAVPSVHVGYALIVAAGLVHHGRRLLVRAIGALYPPFVVLVILATGSHFFLDAAADALRRRARRRARGPPDAATSDDVARRAPERRPGANRVPERARHWHTTRQRPRWPQRVSGARARMNDRRPCSLLQIRELGHGIHDRPGFDTSDFRALAVRLDPHETRLPIDRSADTPLLVVEGSLTVVWRDTTPGRSRWTSGWPSR
jgi:hypothetical protein